MAIKTRDEILASLRSILGDNVSTDESIALIEDITDSMNVPKDTEDWKSRYEENDAMWRKKYSDRFFELTKTKETPIDKTKDENEEKPLSLEDILTESEG